MHVPDCELGAPDTVKASSEARGRQAKEGGEEGDEGRGEGTGKGEGRGSKYHSSRRRKTSAGQRGLMEVALPPARRPRHPSATRH